MNGKMVPMDRSHVAQVARIERECFSMPWTEQMLNDALYQDHVSYIVMEDSDGTVMGYVGLHVILDEGYIHNVAVQERYRRQGIAKRLVEAFCRFGEVNLAFLTLEVRPSNEAGIALYESLGFAQEGRRKDYYQKPKEDAILMTRRFKQEALS